MNILLLNAHSPQNAGDRAILEESLATLFAAFPGAAISVAINDISTPSLAQQVRYLPSLTRWLVAVNAVGGWRWQKWRAVPLLGWLTLAVLVRRSLGWRWLPRDKDRQALMLAYYEADAIVVIGGGHLYAPHSFNIAFLWLWVGLALAVALGKPLLLLPQSFGPLPGALQQALLGWVLRHSTCVVAREYRSMQLLATLRLHRRVLVLPDLAFAAREASLPDLATALPAYAALLHERTRPLIGFTLMDWGAQNQRFQQQAQYEAAIRALVIFVQEQYQAQIVFFSQCYGPTPAHDDRRIARRIAASLVGRADVLVVEDEIGPDLLKAAYRQLDVLVATRMHSAIFALGATVPTLVIGYLHKSQGIMEMLGLGRHALNIEQLSPDALCAAYEQLWKQRVAVRATLTNVMPTVQHTLAQLPQHLRKALHGDE